MVGNVTAAWLAIQTAQSVLSAFDSTIKFGSFLCPVDTHIEDITSKRYYNFIIIGAGTAGSVLANRLSKCPSVSVLLLETGGCPPIESMFLGYFPIIPRTKFDYDMYSVNDHYALQNLQNGVAGLTVGKMLGGSSSLQHALSVRGGIPDYDPWAKAANDSSWSYAGLLPYFKRSENVCNKNIIKKYKAYHGTRGTSIVKRQTSVENCEILEGFNELNYTIRIDTNNNNVLGATEPLLQVDCKYRQSGLVSYIYPVKNRPNLHVLTGATATKIIFNSKKAAVGVQFSFNGSSYVVNRINEIIVSAGAIKSPQLLMLSGVGPSDHLKSKNIPVVSDLPVGKNLHDHVSAPMIFGLEHDASPTPPLDPTKFPTPMTCNYANLDDKNADFAQFQGINLKVPQNSQGLMQLCLNVFKFKLSICQKWFDANIDRKVWFVVPTLLKPVSRGEILLNTTNINDEPLVSVGYLSNKTDKTNLAKFLAFTIKILKTRSFKKIGAEFFDLGLCSNYKKYSASYWECYALAMSSTMWHYCGTAALGSVVDAKLLVKGVTGLRVVDASIIPVVPGGKINTAVLAIAEKIADVILATYRYICCASSSSAVSSSSSTF